MPEFELESRIGFLVDEKSIQQVNNTVNGIKRMIGKALGAVGIGFSLRALNAAVEKISSVNQSLSSAVSQFGDMDDIQKKILDTSKDVLGNYEDIAKNVSDLVKNNKTLFDVDNATRFTDIMTKLVKMSGGSNSEASGVVSSLASAMKNGKFDSGAIETLFAKAPQAIKILTDYYGVSEERLRRMAQAGILKAKDIQKAFMEAGESVDQAFGEMAPTITDVLSSARSELEYFIAETDEMMGVTKTIAEFLRDGFQVVMRGLQKIRSGVVFLSEKLGGMQNTLKLLAVIAASFAIAMNFKKMIQGAQGLLSIFTKLGVKGMFIVGVIALIILAIDDFVHFMQGKNSLLGTIFDKAGIDSDEVREKIVNGWGNIKDFLKNSLDKIKDWFEENGPSIVKGVKTTVRKLVGIIRGAWNFIKGLWDILKGWWDEKGEGISQKLTDLVDKIVRDTKKAWEDAETWWETHGESILELLGGVFEGLLNSIDPLLDALSDLWDILEAIRTGDWSKAWDSLKNLGIDILRAFDEIFDSIYETELGQKFFDMGAEIGENLINGFNHFFDKDKKNILNIVNLVRQLMGKEKLSYEEYWGEPDPDAVKETNHEGSMFYNGHWMRKDTPEGIKEWAGKYYENIDQGTDVEDYVRAQLNPVEDLIYRLYKDHPEYASDEYSNYIKKRYYMPGSDIVLSDKDYDDIWATGHTIDEFYASGKSVKDFIADMKYLQETATVSPTTVGNTIDSHDETTTINMTNTVNNTFNGDTAGQKKSSEAMHKAGRDFVAQMASAMKYPR